MIFFTSDLHIGHENILKYERGPFHPNLEHMHNHIVNTWNTKVSNADAVYILGDMFMNEEKEPDRVNYWLDRLNGTKLLIPGNHDNVKRLNAATSSRTDFEISLTHQFDYRFETVPGKKKYRLICSHYPLASWSNCKEGLGHIHGHCHQQYKPQGRILDIGWDGIYQGLPGIWSIFEVIDYMKSREIYSVDYH